MADASIEVPDFCGMQALDAWLLGHDLGLLLVGPDPDSPEPLMHGIVTRQQPLPGAKVGRWDPVTVWVRRPPDDSGDREPQQPLPPKQSDAAFFDED
ncbi:PASTA domain-containing protein [Nocardia sp. NPDC051832]|uniref:PASTA domain-containing protein n=1 Tax=Nocardia sp. NPDC051832 TaxID=3155673 RepID=UPI0034365508